MKQGVLASCKIATQEADQSLLLQKNYNGTVASQIIFYFICHFWYKFQLFLA
jgi:hypothetical protein